MPDRITLGLNVKKWNRLLEQMKQSPIGERGIVAATLVKVAKRDALPIVRKLTPVKTGKLRGAWRLGKQKFRGRQLSQEIENRDPRARFFEFGTLTRRKKKLGKGTLKRRAQKTARGQLTGASLKGGIRPRAMTRIMIRTLRASGAVIKELQKQYAGAMRQLARGGRGG